MAVFKVVTITIFEVVKLNAIDTGKSRPESGAGDQSFRYSTDKQINVLPVAIE